MSNVALVTGSARGIGRGIAEALSAENYSIIINDVVEESLAEEAIEACRKAGAPKAEYRRADISSDEGRASLIDFASESFGRLDLLVNNAGVAPKVRADVLESSEESYDRVMNINLRGPYFLTQRAARFMVAQKEKMPDSSPKIVNIASISSYTSSPARGEYCLSKAGVSMMTKLFADRLAEYGINVYEIRPGIIMTDMTSGVKEKYDKLIAEGITPIKRWGTPRDIAQAVVAVAKGYLGFSTGQVIDVDGGFHLRRL